MNEQQRMWQLAAQFGAVGIEMSITVLILTVVMGWLLPHHHGVLIGFSMGIIGATMALRRTIRSYRALVRKADLAEAETEARNMRATGPKLRR